MVRIRRQAKAWASAALLVIATASPYVPSLSAQRHDDRHDNHYYQGMRNSVRDNRYNDRYGPYNDHRYQQNNSGGGIGPGYGALIGGGGGAALGALFGGGLKGALIGGAAGAGLGALGGKLAQDSGNNNNDYYNRHR